MPAIWLTPSRPVVLGCSRAGPTRPPQSASGLRALRLLDPRGVGPPGRPTKGSRADAGIAGGSLWRDWGWLRVFGPLSDRPTEALLDP